ncbi:ChaB family protein [Gilvimarinus chinensis]|uniref:ChaB family protein n=1 Tax=Gilvimarinus chinensis TaxID=396005 RepID=UPI00037FA11D|nr:ChaB family protein [Gilvimarinus chinensis]
MYYQNTAELPDSVKNSLPQDGLNLYLQAYNSAWETFADPEKRIGNDDRETVAHKVAWSVVEKSYTKTAQGSWVKAIAINTASEARSWRGRISVRAASKPTTPKPKKALVTAPENVLRSDTRISPEA